MNQKHINDIENALSVVCAEVKECDYIRFSISGLNTNYNKL